MKTVIHPQYARLAPYISSLPDGKYKSDHVYRQERNRVERIVLSQGTLPGLKEDITLVIKKFKTPTRFNRFIYTRLRASKARRAYEYAMKLQELGIGTPDPVAYMEIRTRGLFRTGYFISRYWPGPLLSSLEDLEQEERNRVLSDFAAFTVLLHRKGVLDFDYNITNIFFNKSAAGPYTFSLIDINRMKFKRRLSRKDCVDALKKLDFQMPVLAMFIEEYARLRGWNKNLLCGAVFMERGINLHWQLKKLFKASGRFLGILPSQKDTSGDNNAQKPAVLPVAEREADAGMPA